MKLQLSNLTICAMAFIVTAAVASVGCMSGGGRVAHNLPPSQRLMEPGPGVGGPGPGVIRPASAMMAGPGGGAMGAAMLGPMGGPGCRPAGSAVTSQIAFLGVEGGEVAWDVSGQGMFDSEPLVMPGRQNFSQGAIYRLKLTNIPDREGVELYPTMEVAPVTPRTDAYLAHSPIPLQFTDEDLDQVLSGNYVTKVIYLPDPEFQELALAGVETLVSTRLDPGVDPIAEADRRGAILAILRMGNLDLQLPGQMIAGVGVQHAQYEQAQYERTGDNSAFDGQTVDTLDERFEPAAGYQYQNMPAVPRGMPTTGFAPQVTPPGAMSGVNGPQWGMPMTGTPIGLAGPPHIPLGAPAGLTKHVIRNRTRVLMPPPVHKMKISVKQRPGMNYPRPVNRVNISEANRAGFRMFGGSVEPAVPAALRKMTSRFTKRSDD